jgi:hypothetical protein
MSRWLVLFLHLRRILQVERRLLLVPGLVCWMLHYRDVLVLLTVAISVGAGIVDCGNVCGLLTECLHDVSFAPSCCVFLLPIVLFLALDYF